MSLKRYIRRGRLFRGRDLYQSLRFVGQPPLVARGLQVSGADGQSAVSLRKRQIIPKGDPSKEVRIQSSGEIPVVGSGKWQYLVVEVRATVPGAFPPYEDVPGGFSGFAYNRVEIQNASSFTGLVGYGEDITDTADATLTLLPVRMGSLVQIFPKPDINGSTLWWFSAPNPIQVVCG